MRIERTIILFFLTSTLCLAVLQSCARHAENAQIAAEVLAVINSGQSELSQPELSEEDRLLKSYIAVRYPEILKAETTDREKINLLRKFAAENSATAHGFALDSTRPETLHESIGLLYARQQPEILNYFTANGYSTGDDFIQGGFYCGGIAQSLARLYDLYGYTATAYNMVIYSDNGSFASHVATLVQYMDNGQVTFGMQDAFYNYELKVGDSGDLHLILAKLRNNKPEDIIMAHPAGIGKRYFIESQSEFVVHGLDSWEEIRKREFEFGGFQETLQLKTSKSEFPYYLLFLEGNYTGTSFADLAETVRNDRTEMFGF